MTELMQMFRVAIAEQSDMGMLVAADAMQESDDARNQKFGELLRMYVDMQTMVRTNIVPPTAFGKRYAELNAEFGLPGERRLESVYDAVYSKPLGPFYTALAISQTSLGGNLNMLSDEPIRELHIAYCRPSDPDLAVCLRNYRMESMFHLTLNLRYGATRPADVDALGKAITGLKAPMLQRLTVIGVEDTRKLIQVGFMMGRNIAKGCELWTNGRSYGQASLVRTKK